MPGRVEPEPTPEQSRVLDQHILADQHRLHGRIGEPAARAAAVLGEHAGPAGERAGQGEGPGQRRQAAGGAQSRRGQRSIRSTIMTLLIIPMVTLLGLLAYTLVTTIPGYLADRDNITINNDIDAPLQNLFVQLGTETALTYERGSLPARSPQALVAALSSQLQSQRATTNAAIAAYQAGQAKLDASGLLPDRDRPLASGLVAQLRNVPALRAEADHGSADPLTVFKGYIIVTDAVFPLGGAMPDVQSPVPVFSQFMGTLMAGQALANVETETVLVDGALESGGILSAPAYQLFEETVAQQRQLDHDASTVLKVPNPADPYVAALDSPQFQGFQQLENKIIANGAGVPVPVSQQAWKQQDSSVLGLLSAAETAEHATVTSNAQHQRDVKEYELFGIGGASLLLVLVSSVMLLRFSRRIGRELRGLRVAAQDLAFQRLPSVVSRLRAGEDLDAGAEVPPLRLTSKTLEVTETAEAFSAVQRTAAQAAIEQATMRKAVNNVFRRLARRNQGLLQRQLKMLDEMESGTHDPDSLAQLFRLDHLTTRMRRQAEGLIILSGAAPGRGWRQPVQVVEMLRGAIGEIEDYVRVDLMTDSPDYLQGVGVADVTHLLAELVENAVTFSPPATRVQVRGGRVANGYVVEIEDRGLGMSAETREQLNQRLAQPPDFDVADSDQLGLFVVSRLAARHGIKVALRASSYGGITAIVLLPPALVVTQEEAAYLASREYGGGASSRRQNGSAGAVGGRGLTAAAVGAAADALTGRRRRADAGPVPVGRHSGPLPMLSAPPSLLDAPPLPSRADRPAGASFPGGAGHPSPADGFPAAPDPYAAPPGGLSGGPSGAPSGAPSGGQPVTPPGSGGYTIGDDYASGNGYSPGNGYASDAGHSLSNPFAAGAAQAGQGVAGGQGGVQGGQGGAQSGQGGVQGGQGGVQGGQSGQNTQNGDGFTPLPRRQKMASLAPQLRDPRPEQRPAPRGPRPGKSPEQARALMSSIQRGLRSGRGADVANAGPGGPGRRDSRAGQGGIDTDNRDNRDNRDGRETGGWDINGTQRR